MASTRLLWCKKPLLPTTGRRRFSALASPFVAHLVLLIMARSSSNRRALSDFRHKHLLWFSPALMADWAVAASLVLISIRIERAYPYERAVDHYLVDPELTWPHTWHERVPGEMLDNLTFWAPAAVCAVVAAIRASLHEFHHSLLTLYASRALMRITVEWIKNRASTNCMT